MWLVSGRNDALVLDHQHHRFHIRPRLVDDALGDGDALVGAEGEGFVFEVDIEQPAQDKEELIVIVMLVPVVFALDDAHADAGVVDDAERLVEPGVGVGGVDCINVDKFQRAMQHIEPGLIGVVGHGRMLPAG